MQHADAHWACSLHTAQALTAKEAELPEVYDYVAPCFPPAFRVFEAVHQMYHIQFAQARRPRLHGHIARDASVQAAVLAHAACEKKGNARPVALAGDEVPLGLRLRTMPWKHWL